MYDYFKLRVVENEKGIVVKHGDFTIDHVFIFTFWYFAWYMYMYHGCAPSDSKPS